MTRDTLGRRDFLAVTAAGATTIAGAGFSRAGQQQSESQPVDTMKRPACLFFDVNETLLDLRAMKASVARALGGREELLPLWFTTMLQYSLVTTVGDRYDDFGTIGVAALQMVARNQGIDLPEEAARKAIAPIPLAAAAQRRPPCPEESESGWLSHGDTDKLVAGGRRYPARQRPADRSV